MLGYMHHMYGSREAYWAICTPMYGSREAYWAMYTPWVYPGRGEACWWTPCALLLSVAGLMAEMAPFLFLGS